MTHIIDAEDRIKEIQEMHKIWLQIRNLLVKANTHQPITAEDEKRFLEFKSEASKIQRILHNKIGERVSFGSEKIIDLLRRAVSLNQARQLPENDRREILANWHAIYILITRTLGEYQYYVDNPKGGTKKFSEKKKKSIFKNKFFIIGAIAVIIIIIIIVVFVILGG